MSIRPKRYRTVGLKGRHFGSLLKKGCKNNRKCKCVSVAQRGNWYCPTCWNILEKMAKHKGEHIHDLMISPREELKAEALMLTLSGTL